MADTWFGEGDLRMKRVDLGDGTYGLAVGSYPLGGAAGAVDLYTAFKVAPTILTATYANGNLIGGKQQFLNFVTTAGGSATVQSITLANKVTTTAEFLLIFFDSNPTGTTFTENAPLSLSAADSFRVIGTYLLDVQTQAQTFGTPQIFFANNLELPLTLAAGNTTLYFGMIVQANAYVSTATNLQITLQVR